jgi:hypothetical protein
MGFIGRCFVTGSRGSPKMDLGDMPRAKPNRKLPVTSSDPWNYRVYVTTTVFGGDFRVCDG